MPAIRTLWIVACLGFVAVVGPSARAEEAGQRRVFNGNWSVTDTMTDLLWLAEPPYPGPWMVKQANPKEPASWRDAVRYCAGLVNAGTREWRLPSLKELAEVAAFVQPEPVTCVWSSQKGDGGTAWAYDFRKREEKRRPAKSFLPCSITCVAPPTPEAAEIATRASGAAR